tara:strand:- start:3183 stop:3941 length:759 start_codon:yes stop_codon:yes gene_type:complete
MLINPTNEILVVKHSYLNGNNLDIDKAVNETLKIQEFSGDRKVVPCFEGDLPCQEGDEVLLTHQSWSKVLKDRAELLIEEGIAAKLEDVLQKVTEYKEKNPNQRIVICLEPKYLTRVNTIDQTMELLKKYGIEDAYFDSFFGKQLETVLHYNKQKGTHFKRSLHLIGNYGSLKIKMDMPKIEPDIFTVPYPLSFKRLDKPVIYGAVSKPSQIEDSADQENVLGVYVRLKENPLKILLNSMKNSKSLRMFTVL